MQYTHKQRRLFLTMECLPGYDSSACGNHPPAVREAHLTVEPVGRGTRLAMDACMHVHTHDYVCNMQNVWLCVSIQMEEHNSDWAGLAELSWAIHWTGLCPEHRQLITSYSSLCSQAVIWRMDQMVSRNAYIGKAAPSDVEIFQSFPWLLPDFTIWLYTLYITLVSVFQRNRTS